MEASPKLQAPSTREAPNLKHQGRALHGAAVLRSLVFGISLELGAWSLELRPRRARSCSTLPEKCHRGVNALPDTKAVLFNSPLQCNPVTSSLSRAPHCAGKNSLSTFHGSRTRSSRNSTGLRRWPGFTSSTNASRMGRQILLNARDYQSPTLVLGSVRHRGECRGHIALRG